MKKSTESMWQIKIYSLLVLCVCASEFMQLVYSEYLCSYRRTSLHTVELNRHIHEQGRYLHCWASTSIAFWVDSIYTNTFAAKHCSTYSLSAGCRAAPPEHGWLIAVLKGSSSLIIKSFHWAQINFAKIKDGHFGFCHKRPSPDWQVGPKTWNKDHICEYEGKNNRLYFSQLPIMSQV